MWFQLQLALYVVIRWDQNLTFDHTHHQHAWWPKWTAYKENNVIPAVTYEGGSLRLWRCFVAGGSMALVKPDGIMNSAIHQDILAKNLVASAKRFRLDHILDRTFNKISQTYFQLYTKMVKNRQTNKQKPTKPKLCNDNLSLWIWPLLKTCSLN